MKTLTLKIDQYAKLYFVSILTILCVLAGLYMYLLSATVAHVVMQKQVTSEIHAVNSAIAKLESDYIAKQHAVSEEVALASGFVVAENKVFIERGKDTLALSGR